MEDNMTPKEFKTQILKTIENIPEYYIKYEDYDDNPYHTFELQLIKTGEGYFELKIDNVTFYCHVIGMNGYLNEIMIADKYTNLNEDISAKVKIDEVENVDFTIKIQELR